MLKYKLFVKFFKVFFPAEKVAGGFIIIYKLVVVR